MLKMETFTRPRLTIATEKLDALLVDEVAEALEHRLCKQWVQGAPRLRTQAMLEIPIKKHDCEEWAEKGWLEQPSEYEPAGYLYCSYPNCGNQLHSGMDEYAYENWCDKVLAKTEARKAK